MFLWRLHTSSKDVLFEAHVGGLHQEEIKQEFVMWSQNRSLSSCSRALVRYNGQGSIRVIMHAWPIMIPGYRSSILDSPSLIIPALDTAKEHTPDVFRCVRVRAWRRWGMAKSVEFHAKNCGPRHWLTKTDWSFDKTLFSLVIFRKSLNPLYTTKHVDDYHRIASRV